MSPSSTDRNLPGNRGESKARNFHRSKRRVQCGPHPLKLPHRKLGVQIRAVESFRWTNYRPVERVLEGTRFVPFKTPLGSNFFVNRGNGFAPEDVFETRTLLDYANGHGREIGLVIDLTATNRYYDPREWIDQGIEYAKVECMGHTAHSQEDTIRRFFEIVSDFLTHNANNDKLIGVHCTHGLNRTGYMICRYLVEVEGWDPKTAIEQFELSRGYKIERMQYVTSLYESCRPGCKSYMAVSYRGKPSSSPCTIETIESEFVATVFDVYIWY
ncbi:unnamed protein product [Toxocara canis]|uniref:TYR_PHOSPHATASE_2 domain-containing protein n=1 Tax=Toxocara canis TaxID=6265 RepID=A0A183VA40_TOXCA|nr:unnamed protein product [Toxocara canis]